MRRSHPMRNGHGGGSPSSRTTVASSFEVTTNSPLPPSGLPGSGTRAPSAVTRGDTGTPRVRSIATPMTRRVTVSPGDSATTASSSDAGLRVLLKRARV